MKRVIFINFSNINKFNGIDNSGKTEINTLQVIMIQ